ncbi:MAG: hypothetical protein WD894_14890 [Pirellulales bacterium]
MALLQAIDPSHCAGDDRLLYANNIGLAAAQLHDSAQNDALEVRNVMQRGLRVAAETGTDRVDIQSSMLETLFADLGDGDDQITLFGNFIHGTVELHGGPGWLTDFWTGGNSLHNIYRKRTFDFFS